MKELIAASRKTLSTLLALALVIGLFAALPITASAAYDAGTVATIVHNFDPGNGGQSQAN